MIRDRNIEWCRQRMYIPIWAMQAWELDATPDIAGLGAGAPLPPEISTFGYSALSIAAANDSIEHVMEFPSYWDITKEIGVRIRWMVEATVATDDAILWTVVYDQADAGEVVVAPATVLDTLIVIQSPAVTTTLMQYRSTRGIIAANTFDEAALDGMLAFSIVATTLTQFAANEVKLLGITFDYYPRLTVGGYVALETDRQ